ncbi:alpha/beta hydrolase [Priestia megaterium]|uniref:alpha/beta hydrolase n=1 Tax=Priestia megaterium TaxID=1404 RepID=UPI002D7EF194|nr:alpha/beta hydrolase [Priestia megaterium]MEB4856986.1 alpha/beta hydrolase [Priestia megaterium]
MKQSFYYRGHQEKEIFAQKWNVENNSAKGVVQIAHGMAEHIGRYEYFANVLRQHGYIVYGNDHRGHGQTALKDEDKRFFAEENGFDTVVYDMIALTKHISTEHSGLPIFLFGHSMGSFLTRRYIQLDTEHIHGVILSGTGSIPSLSLQGGILAAQIEIKRKGLRSPSPFLDKLSFGQYNKSFHPARTPFDWLSQDNEAVDLYVNDPYCGGVFTAGFFYDLLTGIKQISNLANIKLVPSSLPIYLVSGEYDPVGSYTKGVVKVYNDFKKAGLQDVSYRFFKECRHELLNELNKDEVIEDILNWLNVQIDKKTVRV